MNIIKTCLPKLRRICKKMSVLGLSLPALLFSFDLNAELYYTGGYRPADSLSENLALSNHQFGNKSIIFVFFNGNQCYACPQTIAALEQIYQQNYQEIYDFFIINTYEDDEYNFVQNYDLNAPLSLVLQRVQNGELTGWNKLDNPQNQIDDSLAFDMQITERINNFLGAY